MCTFKCLLISDVISVKLIQLVIVENVGNDVEIMA